MDTALTPSERAEIAKHMASGNPLPWSLADRLLDLVEALEGRTFSAAKAR